MKFDLFFFSFEQRLIVCLEESLYIHNIRDMKVLHTIRDTPPNPHGLCALSINNDNCFLAYPGSNQIGEVQIFDTINLVRFFFYLLGYLHSGTVNMETYTRRINLCAYMDPPTSSPSSLAKGFGFIGSGVARKPLAREDASLLTCRKNLEKAVLCCEEFFTWVVIILDSYN